MSDPSPEDLYSTRMALFDRLTEIQMEIEEDFPSLDRCRDLRQELEETVRKIEENYALVLTILVNTLES